MSEEQKNRLCSAFDKLHRLQYNVEEEKAGRYKLISTFVAAFESRLEEMSVRREYKFTGVLYKMKQMASTAYSLCQKREQSTIDLENAFAVTYKNCLKLIETNRVDRQEVYKRIEQQLNNQLDMLQLELEKKAKTDLTNFVETTIKEDIQRLKMDLSLEMAKRREVYYKIMGYFRGRLTKLKQYAERDRLYRLSLYDQVMLAIRELSQNVKDRLWRMKKYRESNESQAVQLIYNIIERLKKELINMRY